jgi:hypothetical protein
MALKIGVQARLSSLSLEHSLIDRSAALIVRAISFSFI